MSKTVLKTLLAIMLVSMLASCRPVADGGRVLLRGLSGVTLGETQVDGARIAYMERKATGPTLVLLHGFASEKDSWLRFLRKIPKDYRVIALDLPGHGASSRDADRTYTIDNIVTLVEQTINELVGEPLHVAGASLGGMVATLYTARNPSRVSSLSLFAPAGVYPPKPSEFQKIVETGENPLIAHTRKDFDRLIDFVFYDPPAMPWPVGPAIRKYSLERAPFHQKMWDDFWPEHPTVNDQLPGIGAPVLLVWGKNDRVLDVSSVQVFESLLPDCETVIVDKLGHATVNEQPAEMANLLTDFLTRNSSL